MNFLDKTPDEIELTQAALRIIDEFYLHQSGITYQAQGYFTDDHITIPAWKLDEHRLAQKYIDEATRDKESRRKKR